MPGRSFHCSAWEPCHWFHAGDLMRPRGCPLEADCQASSGFEGFPGILFLSRAVKKETELASLSTRELSLSAVIKEATLLEIVILFSLFLSC